MMVQDDAILNKPWRHIHTTESTRGLFFLRGLLIWHDHGPFSVTNKQQAVRKLKPNPEQIYSV